MRERQQARADADGSKPAVDAAAVILGFDRSDERINSRVKQEQQKHLRQTGE